MPTRVPSWRLLAMSFANSLRGRCSGCRSSDRAVCEGTSSRSNASSFSGNHSCKRVSMSRTIWVGAVAYDPKVVTIWEGMRRYFNEEEHLPAEVVLFQSYEAQVGALLA